MDKGLWPRGTACGGQAEAAGRNDQMMPGNDIQCYFKNEVEALTSRCIPRSQ